MRILITGGAGFIGSHLADALLDEGNQVCCLDDLSLGRRENIAHLLGRDGFEFVQVDILAREKFEPVFHGPAFDCVFHLAANSDIQQGTVDLAVDLERTFLTTFRVLECMKRFSVGELVFASSSAVYGENSARLHEDSGPLRPISFYGAAKLAAEAYISAAHAGFGLKAWVLRFPNVVGERSTHGAMFDFIGRLEANPRELMILGDGTQEKPYLYVRDLVDGMIFAWKNSTADFNCYNLGVDSATTVTHMAEIVCQEMGLQGVVFRYTGGDRGWVGDVPKFRYDLSRIHQLGWKAKRTSDEALSLAVKAELERRATNR